MILPFFSFANLPEAEDFLARLARRATPEGLDAEGMLPVEETVTSILAEVRQQGLEAVVAYTRRFDAPLFTAEHFALPADAPARAADSISREDAQVIAAAAANIRCFHEGQREQSWFQTRQDGAILGQMALPAERAGLYVPGGKGGETPLISSLLMNAIPAQVAGVKEIAVISPPRQDGSLNPHILAAAHLLGITEVYAAGSAWAIAALAYGAGPLRPVDIVAGPGNIFVATAKRMLIGTVGIDMIAGPSEVCIVADNSANPAWIAADMLSQAEHDALASAVCIIIDQGKGRAMADAVAAELERQAHCLPRREIALDSLSRYGAVITVPERESAMALVNRIAPEHLELLVSEPWQFLPLVRHAGAVFLGHYSAEPLGDYYAGPNHVLPTMGTARFSSALSVATFCKKTSIIAASPAFARAGAEPVARLARLEGLEAHARSALIRLEGQTEENFSLR